MTNAPHTDTNGNTPAAAQDERSPAHAAPASPETPAPQGLPEGFRSLKIGIVLRVPDEVTVEQEKELYRPGFWQDALERALGETEDAREGIVAVAVAPLFRAFQKPPPMPPPPPTLQEHPKGGFLPGQSKLVAAWKDWAADYPGSPEAAQFREQLARAER